MSRFRKYAESAKICLSGYVGIVLLFGCRSSAEPEHLSHARLNVQGNHLWTIRESGIVRVHDLRTGKVVSSRQLSMALHGIVGYPHDETVDLLAIAPRLHPAQGMILRCHGRSSEHDLSYALPRDTSMVITIALNHLIVIEYSQKPNDERKADKLLVSGWRFENSSVILSWRKVFENAAASTASAAASANGIVALSLENRSTTSPDTNTSGRVVVLEGATGEVISESSLTSIQGGQHVAISNDGMFVLIADAESIELRSVSNLDVRLRLRSPTKSGRTVRCSVSSDGTCLALADDELYGLTSPDKHFQLLQTSQPHDSSPIVEIGFAGNTNTLMSVTESGSVELWDTQNGSKTDGFSIE